ncbi:OmpA family protein [Pontibacter ramchanderi]|uniref:OmpA family protein n=1 Tax=Pontibacter ramchanderi TaxID=1179743 RepID=A0A2N3UAJ3_9BACT|nr:OmpA family protein [Pontibacter ramchanderi]PKV66420.1 OmpA family protein [Pontibacter ramchanderi]
MRTRAFFTGLLALVLLSFTPVAAQINVGKNLRNKINSKINQKVDQQVDKSIDETLEGKKEASADNSDSKRSNAKASSTGSEEVKMKAWSKYDFVPGDKVLFSDNLAGEENGEFPSRWDLNKGNAEVADFGGEPVINLVASGTSIKPLMKRENWLPETFTIEMDLYFDSDNGNVAYDIFLVDDIKDYKEAVNGHFWDPIDVRANGVRFKTYGSESQELKEKGVNNQWRHLSIAFNKRSMKVYLDEERLINIPNVTGTPTGLRIEVDKRIDANTMVKNVLIAEGGKKLYDQITADGKIVTYGIKFDVNKADIRPESAGTLQSIAKLMQEQPNLRFTVEGHTDSDGDENVNLKLSQQRAESVRTYLVGQGIAADRLEPKGWGESKPIDKNPTAQAKSNNRRVEFVKR